MADIRRKATATTNEVDIAVLSQKVDDLREDVKEVKSMVGDKIATREYVDDRINPLKKLVYTGLGLAGTLLIGLLMAIVGLVLNK